MSTLLMDLQPENDPAGIVFTESGSSMFSRQVQCANVFSPISVTELGILIL